MTCEFIFHHTVLASCGYTNKLPHVLWLKQRKGMYHSYEGQESEIGVSVGRHSLQRFKRRIFLTSFSPW